MRSMIGVARLVTVTRSPRLGDAEVLTEAIVERADPNLLHEAIVPTCSYMTLTTSTGSVSFAI